MVEQTTGSHHPTHDMSPSNKLDQAQTCRNHLMIFFHGRSLFREVAVVQFTDRGYDVLHLANKILLQHLTSNYNGNA